VRRPLCRGKEKGLREEGALKFGISEVGPAGEDGVMIQGAKLWRERMPVWGERTSFLLLNPRLQASLRDRILQADFPDLEEHVWVATSGTGGAMKVVALSRTALEASARAVNRHLAVSASDCWLNPLPTFHVGGLGIEVRAALAGARSISLATWNAADFVRRANEAGATLSSLVPTQVYDLVAVNLPAPPSLRAVVVGGGACDSVLQAKAIALGWPLLPSYGLTEAASQVATAQFGADLAHRLPLLDHVEARVGDNGVLELCGPSLLTGWMLFDADGNAQWADPKFGSWYRTGDRVELVGQELRVLGRVDDLVKIRGELVDIATLGRELQSRVPHGAVVLRCVADDRNGLAIQVVAENEAALAEARCVHAQVFPSFARPQEFVVGPIERTALGKLVRL